MFDMREVCVVNFADIAKYARERGDRWDGDLHLALLGKDGPAPGLYSYFEGLHPEICNLIEDFMDYHVIEEFYWTGS